MKNKKTILTCAIALILASISAGAEVVDRVVAVVNNSVITLSELNAATAIAMETVPVQEKTGEAKIADIKTKVLENLVNQKLIKLASDKAGIEISEREVDNAVEDIKKQNNMPQDKLLLALAQSGLTLKEYRNQMKEQIRQMKFINKEFRSKITIPDEDVADYFKQNHDEFAADTYYKASIIVIQDNDTSGAKIKAVKDGLAKGEKFRDLARKYSSGPSSSTGGDLGFLKMGEANLEIEQAALALKPGEISTPFKTSDGIYFIQLNEIKKSGTKQFEDVKAQIRDKLYKKIMDERFSLWLKEIRNSANVDIRL